MIPVYKPYFYGNEKKYVTQAIESSWVSSSGYFLVKAEEILKDYLGVKYLLLTSNGTTAMHLVALALRDKTGATEIIAPNSVYVAAWNSLRFTTPFLMYVTDTDLDTWNYPEEELRQNIYRANACLVVHNLGNIVNVPELKRKYPHITFIEDSCEGFGGTYEGKKAGTESLASAYSWYANKSITSGEGGAFVTNDEKLYILAKKRRGQGQSETRFVHDILGFNYRLTNLQAALLVAQLEQLSKIQVLKESRYLNYKDLIESIGNPKLVIQKTAENTTHSNWMFGIRVIGNPGYHVAEKFFLDRDIETRPFFYPISSHKHLRGSANNSPKASLLQKEIIILPSYPELTFREQQYVTSVLEEYVDKHVP